MNAKKQFNFPLIVPVGYVEDNLLAKSWGPLELRKSGESFALLHASYFVVITTLHRVEGEPEHIGLANIKLLDAIFLNMSVTTLDAYFR